MSDVQQKCHKAMQLCDLIEKDNSDSSDSAEEDGDDVNVILTELQQMSTHIHESAFQNIWFGANPHGIYGAVPTDLMHAFLHGIVPYAIKTLLSPFTNKEKHFLDDLVYQTLVTIHSSQRTKYPRCSFTHGISNLKLLTATKWAGVAFTVALMMTTEAGYKLFNKVCNRWEKNSKKNLNGTEGENVSDVDEVGLTDSVSNDNENDSDEEHENDEIDSNDATEAEDDIAEFDA